MYFTVYRTVNKLNGKVYIGKHQTNNLDDNYLGSGKMLQRALKKHGTENFTKEILFVFDTEVEMNTKEAELVTEAFCSEETNYNLCPGGQGGWGYLNSTGLNNANKDMKSIKRKISLKLTGVKNPAVSERNKLFHRMGILKQPTGPNGMLGKKHSDEARLKMSEKASIKNSQSGSMWITNGAESKKINKSHVIPEGWYKGRVIKND